MHTIVSDISAIVVDMLELAKSLNDEEVLARPGDDHFGSLMEDVIKHFQRLEHMSPILSLIIEALVNHVHDLVKLG